MTLNHPRRFALEGPLVPDETIVVAGDRGPVCYKDISGFPGYRVGSDGSVWSCWKRGSGRSFVISEHWRQLKPRLTRTGHLTVTPRREGLKRSPLHVHRLVLQAFIGPCPEGMECCHNDGNPQNNRLENLRWDTRQANHDDSRRHGTRIRGSRHHQAKLTDLEVEAIRALRRAGWKLDKISATFAIHFGQVSKICRGQSWQHL